jgi:hypothetical protein
MDDGTAGPGLSRRVYLHIRSNVWGIVALFVALGGVAWADAQIGASDIQHNAIHSSHIRNGAVRTADLALGAVTDAQIADDAVGGDQVDEASLDRTSLQSRIANACPAGQAIAAVSQNGTPTCTPNLQSRVADACPSGQAIASVGDNGTPSCTANLQSRIANGCPSGQAIASVAESGAPSCTSNLQSRIANACPGGQAITSVAESGTPSCTPVGAAGAARINFSQGSCSEGSPCTPTLYSANGWVITGYCSTAFSTYGYLQLGVVTAPGGGTTNYAGVGQEGGNPNTYTLHNGFPGTGTITSLTFTDLSRGEVGTIILNSPAQTISIPFEMYGVTDAGEDNSYCEMYGTATTA